MVYGVDQSVDRSLGQSQLPEPKDDIFYEKDKFNSLPYVSLREKVKGAFLPAWQ